MVQVVSVDFVTADNASNILQNIGLTRTDQLRVDDPNNSPTQQPPEGDKGINMIWGNQPDSNVTGTPDVWLRINVSGEPYVFPGYSPEG